PRARAVVCVRTDKGAPSLAGERVVRELLGARGVELLALESCTDEAVTAAARAKSAQGAVMGAVELEPAGAIRGSDRVAAHARARLRLVDGDGKLLADGSGERYAYEATETRADEAAAAAAVDEAARALGPALAQRWRGDAPVAGVRVRVARLSR